MLQMLAARQSRRRRSFRLGAVTLAALVAVGMATFHARAQSGGTLSGSVYDPSGGVLPATEMTLASNQQVVARARSDSSGRFQFASVPSGRYTLATTLAGFTSVQRDLDLQEGRVPDQAITLQVGHLQEAI